MKQIPFGPDIKGSWDTIEFANSEDPGKVALQVDVHFVKSGNGIRLLELRNTTQGIDDPNSWHTNPGSSKMFNGPKGNFTIQIWEDEDTKSCLIIIFSQSPNSALSKFHTTFRSVLFNLMKIVKNRLELKEYAVFDLSKTYIMSKCEILNHFI